MSYLGASQFVLFAF